MNLNAVKSHCGLMALRVRRSLQKERGGMVHLIKVKSADLWRLTTGGEGRKPAGYLRVNNMNSVLICWSRIYFV